MLPKKAEEAAEGVGGGKPLAQEAFWARRSWTSRSRRRPSRNTDEPGAATGRSNASADQAASIPVSGVSDAPESLPYAAMSFRPVTDSGGSSA
jgi:hypothetical protein